ncbi:hypothetical protein ACIBL5_37805 [Streptomyces sp. NPDC050516]|uniref:hypothetical protein n=1 Tax=Streptomyces sp. NPDC050516 TaxID=3365621 RepID=UPI0037966D15
MDLLARHKTGGALKLYKGTSPAGEGLGDGDTATQIGTNWTAAHIPLLASGGDADNDNLPDLWATTTDNSAGLRFYPRITPTTHGTPIIVGTGGWNQFQAIS